VDSNPSDQVWCSNYKKFRDPASFEKTKYGKERKTCNQHDKRRNIDAVFDNWGSFEEQLAAWNCPVYTQFELFYLFLCLRRCRDRFNLSISLVYSVWIACLFSLSESQAGSEHRSQLNKAINELSELIWKKGGFRFWHRRTNNWQIHSLLLSGQGSCSEGGIKRTS
jgi:hypothetical protein